MYSYVFEFYKPGKNIYSKEEIQRTINYLLDRGYELKPISVLDNHFKNGYFEMLTDEAEINLKITKSGIVFGLYLSPALEEAHGLIGELTIIQEAFESDPKKSEKFFIELANGIFLALDPLFAWGDHELELGRLGEYLSFERVSALAWANFFSADLVKKMGGLENVVLFPDEVDSYKGKDWSFAYVLTSYLPTESIPERILHECQTRYPGVILRG